MSESKALMVRQQLTPSVWEMIRSVAPSMHQSRLFGVNSPDQAAAIMLKGYELGLSLTASFEFVQIVEGKPALSPRGCLGLIHQRSDLIEVKIKESTDKKCTVWMRRKDTGFEYEGSWTIEDAKRAGLVRDKSGWEKYPANMLRWRCVGFVADVVCPDLIGGMKRADELGADLTPDGDVIQGQWKEVKADAPDPAMTAGKPRTQRAAFDADALIEKYGVEDILAACGGTLPTTDEEWSMAADALENQHRELNGEVKPVDPGQAAKHGFAPDVVFRTV
jgi:hypothetical protein